MGKFQKRAIRFAFFSTCVLLISIQSPLVASDGLRTAALTGYSAPGTNPEANFTGFTTGLSPSLNNLGQVAFVGQVGNSLGIWSEGGGGGLKLVALQGNPAAGTSAGVNFQAFAFFHGPILSDSGHTAFIARVNGGGADANNDVGIWREQNGVTSLVAREGNPAPGTATNFNQFFGSLDQSSVGLLLNEQGHVAFHGTAGQNGIWADRGTGLELIAVSGTPAPGTGVNFVNIHHANGPVMNSLGQIAFNAEIGLRLTSSSIWVDRGGTLELVAESGSAVPGLADGFIFAGYSYHPGFNTSGQLAFTAIARSGISNIIGVWSEGRGNGLELVASSNSHAPGTDPAVVFDGDFSERVINGRGQTAFLSRLQGPGVNNTNSTGLWSEGGGNGLKLLARAGDPAPGLDAGINFGTFTFLDVPILNSIGQAAFTSVLVGPGINNGNNRAIWAEDVEGNLKLIARTGDQLDVSDDPLSPDLRTVVALNFQTRSGNDDGKRSGFNDRGQVAFWARFLDGTQGIFVSDIVAVPEPGSLLLSVLLISPLMTMRRI